MDGAVRIAVEHAPGAVFQFDDAARSLFDQLPGELLMVDVAAALDGVAAVYVAYQPDLALPGAVAAVSRFFAEARAAGVGKIVLLSGRGEPEAQEAEEALRATSLDWTILRCSWFFQNFSENFFLDAILAGEIVLPDTLAPEPFVDADDIAEIAVAAFADARHSHQLYEITGAEALTFQQAIAAIAEACGRRIDYVPVSQEAYRAGLVEQGLPPEVKTRLHAAIVAALNDPSVKDKLLAQGFEIVADTPEHFAKFQATEFHRWKQLIESRHISVD